MSEGGWVMGFDICGGYVMMMASSWRGRSWRDDYLFDLGLLK